MWVHFPESLEPFSFRSILVAPKTLGDSDGLLDVGWILLLPHGVDGGEGRVVLSAAAEFVWDGGSN